MKNIIKTIIFTVFSMFLIRKGKSDAIYITFDDGPHIKNTQKILNILKNNNVKATFFMVGQEMEKYPEVVSCVYKEGHSIGYHSYSHDSLKSMPFKEIVNDFKKAKKLESEFGIKFKLYRPPYGDLTFLSLIYLALNNIKIVLWSLDSMDSFSGKEEVLENVSPDKISNGEILLFHDDYELTANILPEVLGRLSKESFVCKKL